MDSMVIVVDSRLWLPPKIPRGFGKDLRAAFTHSNPDYHRKKAMGFSTWGISTQVKTHESLEDALGRRLTLPRGGIHKLREIAEAHGIRLRYQDRTTEAPAHFPRFMVNPEEPDHVLRWYQEQGVDAAAVRRQGVVRAPTGSGKTVAALAFIHRIQQRTLVVMRDGNLLEQWTREAQGSLGLKKAQIGVIRGGRKYHPGRPLVLGLQQSLHSMGPEGLADLFEADPFGAVVVDEVQTVAARTFQGVVDHFPTRFRIGFSADETRKDKKEFLIYDSMGPVIHEIDRTALEREGVIHPVTVRVVPTDFRADWYRAADPGDRDFTRLIEEMTEDAERNVILLSLAQAVVQSGEIPAMVFTHRREHAHRMADAELSVRHAIPCGLLLGGAGEDRERFREDREKLLDGRLAIAIGTFNALGVGINLPVVRAGIVATPISGSNRQFFGQVRGRICRVSEASGKDSAVLYYLWDRHVFPNQLRNLLKWNDGRVEILNGERWVHAGRG